MYTRFFEGDIVTQEKQELVTSTWTNNVNNLTVAFTASADNTDNGTSFASPTSSGQFFIDVYNADPASDTTAEVQYSVAYGNRLGSGSPAFTDDTGSIGISAARVVYNQYRQLVFNDETQNFTFGSHTPNHIYVININRARYKQRLTLGSLSLFISGGFVGATTLGASRNVKTGSVRLTDDSVTNGSSGNSNLGPYYNIVSGSLGVLSGSTINQTTSGSYGLFYPEAGLIILNPDQYQYGANLANGTNGLQPITGSSQGTNTDRNHVKLLDHISGANQFIVDTTEEINSQFYFVRARNNEYNYTNNQSFVDNNNNLLHDSMINNPKTFITTVGLYSDSNELLGVAKLSQPVAKDFTKEALIRVKLDY